MFKKMYLKMGKVERYYLTVAWLVSFVLDMFVSVTFKIPNFQTFFITEIILVAVLFLYYRKKFHLLKYRTRSYSEFSNFAAILFIGTIVLGCLNSFLGIEFFGLFTVFSLVLTIIFSDLCKTR